MTTLAWVLLGVGLGLTCVSLLFSGWVFWQFKGLRFGLFAGLENSFEALKPELSAEAMKEFEQLKSSFRVLETEWTSQHGAMNKIAGRIERRLQEIEGTHKGGENAKGKQEPENPPLRLVSNQFSQALEFEKKASS